MTTKSPVLYSKEAMVLTAIECRDAGRIAITAKTAKPAKKTGAKA